MTMKRMILSGLVAVGVAGYAVSAVADSIHDAASRGDVARVQQLLQREPALVYRTVVHGMTPLHVAARMDRPKVVAVLLENRANINARDKDGWTPLHWAALHGHVDVAALLLSKSDVMGVDVNAADIEGRTPLRLAMQGKREAMIEFLRKHGAKETADQP
jgi:ankyrin repeat protein